MRSSDPSARPRVLRRGGAHARAAELLRRAACACRNRRRNAEDAGASWFRDRPALRLGALLAIAGATALAALAALATKAHAAPPGGPAAATMLTIAGSGTMSPLVQAIAERFREQRPEIAITVRPVGSDRGLHALRASQIDIAMFSRPLDENMTDLVGVPIARDGVSLVVHRDNPVVNLTSAQISAIYRRQTGNWRAVGGEDRAIRVLAPEPGRSSAELFSRHFGVDLSPIPAANIVSSNAQRLAAVAGDRGAIVFMSIGEAERAVQAGQPVHLVGVDGIAATSRNVRKGDFPIARPLTLVTRGLPKGLAREFIEFALSSSVTGLIRQLDFVPYVD